MQRIQEFKVKKTIETTLALTNKQVRATKSGNPYLHLDLQDKTGKIVAKVWSEEKSSLPWDSIEAGTIYLFTAVVQEFKEELQLNITDIQAVKQFDIKDFIPSIAEDPNTLIAELNEYRAMIKDPFVIELVDFFFEDEGFFAKFCEAPAAKSVHDSTIGGLLRHTTRLIRLALYVCKQYEETTPNIDLIIAGLLFHDMEKINEYTMKRGVIEFTHEGQCIGHASMAMLSIDKAIATIDDFPFDTRNLLQHIIASHAAEFDPIRLPGTIEAHIVHLCDMMDSQIVHFDQEWTKNSGNGWKKDYLTQRWCYYPERKK